MKQTLGAGASYGTVFHGMLAVLPMRRAVHPSLNKADSINLIQRNWGNQNLDHCYSAPRSRHFIGLELREAGPYWTNIILRPET